MRLLILGAIGPYPERINNFTKEGHQIWYVCTEKLLYGDQQYQYEDITAGTFQNLGTTIEDGINQLLNLIKANRIDAVYSLLNVWDGSNRVTAALLSYGCPIPVIRHYKEHYLAPSEDERWCLEESTGVILINEESKDYFASLYRLPRRTACFDADLIPRRYLSGTLQPKLSSLDKRPHILIAGSVSDDGGRYDYRDLICELTGRGAHVHLYGNFRRLQNTGQLNNTADVEDSYRTLRTCGLLHFHQPIHYSRFVDEWSCYDAGLLHVPRPDDAFRSLNMPNRYSAYMAAGVPVALPDGAMPAMQRHLEELNAAIIYNTTEELIRQLPDAGVAAKTIAARERVTFETVYPKLIAFINSCINRSSG